MKLRCVANSVRLRLRKSDINLLIDRHKVEERVEFGQDTVFRFALMMLPGKHLTASFDKGRILISLPISRAEEWIYSDQVGIEEELILPGGKQLHILIEKDFPCKDREEDKSDTFEELAAQHEADQC